MNLIFDELNFEDLLNMNEVNKEYAKIAAYAFKRKFASRTVSILSTRDLLFGWEEPAFLRNLKRGSVEQTAYSIGTDRIQLKSIFLSLKTLKYFGNTIEKLDLSLTNADTLHSKMISKYVNDYCIETLVELSFNIRKGEFLRYYRKPFKSVTNVSFNFWSESEFGNNTLAINETFPSLRILSLNHPRTDFKGEHFKCFFPHLEHLSLQYGYKYSNRDFIMNLLHLNSHIRSIHFESCPEYLLRKISAMLPQLENLSIGMGLSVEREIRFENVTKFKMTAISNSLNVVLPQLQELHMFFTPGKFTEWCSFFNMHGNLSRLQMQFWKMTPAEFEGLLSYLPNLEEISLKNNYMLLQIDPIIKFLTNDQKLLTLHLENALDFQKEQFHSMLGHEWAIQNHGDSISFRRIITNSLLKTIKQGQK